MFSWFQKSSDREQELEIKLRAKELECDLLAQINENLRQWLLANTSTAIQVCRSMGVPDKWEENK